MSAVNRSGRAVVSPDVTQGEAPSVAEALWLSRALLPDCERVFGPDHPNTLTTRYWIADLRQQIGEES